MLIQNTHHPATQLVFGHRQGQSTKQSQTSGLQETQPFSMLDCLNNNKSPPGI